MHIQLPRTVLPPFVQPLEFHATDGISRTWLSGAIKSNVLPVSSVVFRLGVFIRSLVRPVGVAAVFGDQDGPVADFSDHLPKTAESLDSWIIVDSQKIEF